MLRKRHHWRLQREEQHQQITSRRLPEGSNEVSSSGGSFPATSSSSSTCSIRGDGNAVRMIRTIRRMGRGTETMTEAVIIILLFLLTSMISFMVLCMVVNNLHMNIHFPPTHSRSSHTKNNDHDATSQLEKGKGYYHESSSLQRWTECGCHVNADGNNDNVNPSKRMNALNNNNSARGGGGGRIAYLVTLHNQRTLQDSLPLMKAISTPKNIILIHIDVKMTMEEYMESSLYDFVKNGDDDDDDDSDCQACGATVLVERKFDVQWGKW